jgi:magnesium-transporting ATPase (P-type)
MKRGSTFFLMVVVVLIGIAVLALCIFWLPEMASEDAKANPEAKNLQYPFLVSAYVMSIPFFTALYQVLKLLSNIGRDKVFSELSVRAFRYIKYCAITICIFIVLGIIYVAVFLEGDRAGVVGAGLMCIFASGVVAIFGAIFQKRIKAAIKD